MTLDEARKATNGQVAEGVTSSQSIYELALDNGVDMPLTEAVFSVCHKDLRVDDMIAALMGRSKKSE